MSELTTAARPYARAVFEMAKQDGDLAKWSDSLAFMSTAAGNDAVQELLAMPKMAKQAGAEAFIKLCDGMDGKLDDKAKNLVKMLAENNRLVLLPEISEIYDTLKDEEEGTVEAVVNTAKSLSEADEKAIMAALKKRLGRKVKLKVNVDKSLLGGAIIHAGDLVIDGSLKGRLSKMKSALENS